MVVFLTKPRLVQMTKGNAMNASLQSELRPGPVAIILNEDGVELESTVRHCRTIGFPNVLVAGASGGSTNGAINVIADPSLGLSATLSPLITALTGRWIYYGYNAEYLYFPFCEDRTIADAAQFVDEERRKSVFSTVVDLYARELETNPLGIDLDAPLFDKSGYFSQRRHDGSDYLDRQFHVYGGLKWRFAEHVPWGHQRIERISFFRAEHGLTIDDRGVLSDPEMNTLTSPWHNSMTFAVASFRVAKSLRRNPGSLDHIRDFSWSQSEPFSWRSDHLMERGFMEPGQWF